VAFENLTTTDEGKASFWLIADPLVNMSQGRSLDRKQLQQLITNDDERAVKSGGAK
jgi:hypothetical protein